MAAAGHNAKLPTFFRSEDPLTAEGADWLANAGDPWAKAGQAAMRQMSSGFAA